MKLLIEYLFIAILWAMIGSLIAIGFFEGIHLLGDFLIKYKGVL